MSTRVAAGDPVNPMAGGEGGGGPAHVGAADDEGRIAFDLRPLPERLNDMLGGERPDVAALVAEEHAQWHDLHDRLIAIVAALIDDAVERGEQLAPLLQRLGARTSVGVDHLVGPAPTPAAVAALLRAHHSVGTARVSPDAVTFTHDCGTGLAFWRRNPTAPTLAEGEVEGVPAGVPRYCARCITTIDAFGKGHWRVRPPASPEGRCRWEVDGPVHGASGPGGPESQAAIDDQH